MKLVVGSVLLASAGCLIDDTAKPRGQASTPTANVPDSGAPGRRESADTIIRDSEAKPPADATPEEKSK